MVFQCINIRLDPWEVVKTAAFGLDFQHLPRDLAIVNVWKTMFDPYSDNENRDSDFRSYMCSRATSWICLISL